MADVRAFRSGNWSDTTATSPWHNGTALFAPAAGDVVYANNFTINVDTSVTTGTVTIASATSRVWKDGGTATATGGGEYQLANGVTLNAAVSNSAQAKACVTLSGSLSASISGSITSLGGNNAVVAVQNNGTGTLTISGNITNSAANISAYSVNNNSTGTVTISGNVTGGAASTSYSVFNNSTGIITINGSVTAGSGSAAVVNNSTGTITITGDITAVNGVNAFVSANILATNRLSGSFINSANGTAAVYAAKYILNTTPLAAKTRYARDGAGAFVDMFTADNTGLGPATSDVRSGISYGGGLVGTCAVPAAGSVALGVPVGSGTGTALLTGSAVASAVWDALTSSLTTSGSIGERVKNCATAEIVGEITAAALSTP